MLALTILINCNIKLMHYEFKSTIFYRFHLIHKILHIQIGVFEASNTETVWLVKKIVNGKRGLMVVAVIRVTIVSISVTCESFLLLLVCEHKLGNFRRFLPTKKLLKGNLFVLSSHEISSLSPSSSAPRSWWRSSWGKVTWRVCRGPGSHAPTHWGGGPGSPRPRPRPADPRTAARPRYPPAGGPPSYAGPAIELSTNIRKVSQCPESV